MSRWVNWAVVFFIHSIIQVGIGIDRIKGYNYNEYAEELSKHAFVGGDAYNYIINANIQTGCFVLAAASLIVGILLICSGAIIQAIKEKNHVEGQRSE